MQRAPIVDLLGSPCASCAGACCPACSGTGYDSDALALYYSIVSFGGVDCPECRGSGYVIQQVSRGFFGGAAMYIDPCTWCRIFHSEEQATAARAFFLGRVEKLGARTRSLVEALGAPAIGSASDEGDF